MAAQAEADRLAQEQAQAERQAALESARSKLVARGLTEDEVTALLA